MATIYRTATSLDGFITDERESLSWLFATPTHDQDPETPYAGDALGLDRFFERVGAIVLGVNTLEWMRRELTTDGGGFDWPYPQPSWVVTHRAVEMPEGVRSFAGDVAVLHPDLVAAAEGKDVWVVGGGDLAGQFCDAGLLDQVWLDLAPVTLGAGRPLLPRRVRLRRRELARDGQLTTVVLDVVGPEPALQGE